MYTIFCLHIKISPKPFKPQDMWSLDQQIGSSGNNNVALDLGSAMIAPFFTVIK